MRKEERVCFALKEMMIKVEKLSYSFPDKDLYREVSFTIEDGQHVAFIGSNGTGKTTLVDMLMDTEKYLYDGKIIKDENQRIGLVSQGEYRSTSENEDDIPTVYEFLSEEFVRIQKETEDICQKMGETDELDELLEKYQNLLDLFSAIDGDNCESNIKKQLAIAGLSDLETLKVSVISGGEYKLIQVIRQMLLKPSLLIMDEPDVFLDFENLTGLSELINSYKGTMLVITHNRYLLNHCFNKILHLEDTDIQEFEGNFVQYNFSLLAKKIELQEQVAKEQAEIDRNQKLVNKLRTEASRIDSVARGKSLKARVSYLARLEARRIKAPFVQLRQPNIVLPIIDKTSDLKAQEVDTNDIEKFENSIKQLQDKNCFSKNQPEDFFASESTDEKKAVLSVCEYSVAFDETLLENVSFEIKEGEKVAIVGPNGTGKTTLLRNIYKNNSGFIAFADDVKTAFLSQNHGEMLNINHTIYEEFEEGLENGSLHIDKMQEDDAPFKNERAKIAAYLKDYYFEPDVLDNKIEILSGGEKNLLQLAKIGASDANFLLLDEPTSHLDTYSQIALEKAIADYKGTVLMVSHDFYSIANIVDYVLFVENKSVRKMRIRSFRKMIYQNHFNKDYLELEQKKKELESRIENFLKENEFLKAKLICDELEAIVEKM